MQYSSGFILGLSTGVVCLAYCGPVLIPFLMGEGKGVYKNIGSVSLFLLGRLGATGGTLRALFSLDVFSVYHNACWPASALLPLGIPAILRGWE